MNVDSSNNSIVTCHVNATLTPGMGNLNISVNGYPYHSALVLEISKNGTKNDCGDKSLCSMNGTCVNGLCQCNDGYGGYHCENRLLNQVMPIPDNHSPSFTIGSEELQYQFNVVAVQELDQFNNIVQEVLTTKWVASTSNKSNIITNQYQLDKTNYNISIQFQMSTEPRIVEFAGDIAKYPANSLKMMISIYDWNYLSNLNSIRVVFLDKANDLNISECATHLSTINQSDYLYNIKFIKVVKGPVTYFARFLPHAMVNGRISRALNQIINATVTTGTGSSYIGTVLPLCQQCLIDPDFSVLTSIDDGSDNNGGHSNNTLCNPGPTTTEKPTLTAPSSSMSTWKIATIAVVLGVVGIAAATAAVLVHKHRITTKRENKRIEMRLASVQ
ncbi:hypothetical protein SAMD00019534_018320 [Acytostelium subglobosum LB1]|uniref:hypothetical protein n=1 Tax=Acytostelium subglobosum LB1 TaxID=1410327 RepID=UPI000644FB09|nr:hypothetical protein SAMD00019534_018320 [Acytostelium subglobosum LB1]GAM18657.1 hypothetical protein SAMD00019534_018320 [Acytostelium subglobosum LB1]|eukprot:XP_012757877.1 hypothetical protein SAMD00019534_018320 [Acytostelium subglobosum LB1]